LSLRIPVTPDRWTDMCALFRANYMGHVELFEPAGFVPVRETSKRVVMRLER
jgi:hypothetical protein